MAGRLSSKAVIVTGGSTGIGRAVAERLVAEGGAGGVNARLSITPLSAESVASRDRRWFRVR